MADMREMYEDAGHGLRGPHQAIVPPLRLRLERNGATIVVTRPETLVGRHSATEVRLAHTEVSRRHCRFVFVQGRWRVQDLRSMNGVFLNGERVTDALLSTGDRLHVGPIVLLVDNAGDAPKEAGQQVLQQIAERFSAGEQS
jgi:pSer/pThr/pTyr-binding forkhead associated (FHA) protein